MKIISSYRIQNYRITEAKISVFMCAYLSVTCPSCDFPFGDSLAQGKLYTSTCQLLSSHKTWIKSVTNVSLLLKISGLLYHFVEVFHMFCALHNDLSQSSRDTCWIHRVAKIYLTWTKFFKFCRRDSDFLLVTDFKLNVTALDRSQESQCGTISNAVIIFTLALAKELHSALDEFR